MVHYTQHNIGTTVTAWIMSLIGVSSENVLVQMLKPESFAPVLAFVGIVLIMLAKLPKRKEIGNALVGFAVLMFGMMLMSSSVSPLADSPAFTKLLTAFKNPLLGVLTGLVVTAIIQSSAASIGMLQALSMTGGITYGIAIPIIMGQNIGTCATAVLSSIGVNRNAKRVAAIHLSFNLIGTAVFMIIYQELADHYATAIIPARVRKPDDKAAAESSVRYVSTWITAALRDRTFFSIADAQQAVAEKLEEVNQAPFQKRPGCRRSAFEQEEKEFLQPLPILSYEPSVWSQAKVGVDYLVTDGRNKYSVPYDLIGETVNVRLTRDIVEVFYRGSRVAAHVRLAMVQCDPVIKPEHMPEAHRKFALYNAEEFTAWAASVGENTAGVVRFFLTSGREVEQG